MINQSQDIIYVEDMGSMYDCLPSEDPIDGTTPDINQWLLSRTRKRLKRMGLDSDLRHRGCVTIKQFRIESESVSRIIAEMDLNLRSLFMEPHCLIMGHNQFENLIGERVNAGSGYSSFWGAFELRDGYKTIYGIEIKVIPGFDNLAMIPIQVLQNNGPQNC